MKQIAILAIFLGCISLSMAQNLPVNPLDQKYTPPAGGFFDAGSKLGKVTKQDRSGAESNLIGFNPSLLLRRIATVSYTRLLGKKFGVRAGIGFSYNADRLMLSTVNQITEDAAFDPSSISEDSKESEWFSYFMTESAPLRTTNLFYELGLRFYTEEETTDSPYIEFSYRSYSNKLMYSNSQYSNNSYPLTLDSRGIQLVTGRNFSFGSHSVHDVYFGVGAKFFTIDKLTPTFATNPNTGNTFVQSFSQTGEKARTAGYSILIGYVYHFAF